MPAHARTRRHRPLQIDPAVPLQRPQVRPSQRLGRDADDERVGREGHDRQAGAVHADAVALATVPEDFGRRRDREGRPARRVVGIERGDDYPNQLCRD